MSQEHDSLEQAFALADAELAALSETIAQSKAHRGEKTSHRKDMKPASKSKKTPNCGTKSVAVNLKRKPKCQDLHLVLSDCDLCEHEPSTTSFGSQHVQTSTQSRRVLHQQPPPCSLEEIFSHGPEVPLNPSLALTKRSPAVTVFSRTEKDIITPGYEFDIGSDSISTDTSSHRGTSSSVQQRTFSFGRSPRSSFDSGAMATGALIGDTDRGIKAVSVRKPVPVVGTAARDPSLWQFVGDPQIMQTREGKDGGKQTQVIEKLRLVEQELEQQKRQERENANPNFFFLKPSEKRRDVAVPQLEPSPVLYSPRFDLVKERAPSPAFSKAARKDIFADSTNFEVPATVLAVDSAFESTRPKAKTVAMPSAKRFPEAVQKLDLQGELVLNPKLELIKKRIQTASIRGKPKDKLLLKILKRWKRKRKSESSKVKSSSAGVPHLPEATQVAGDSTLSRRKKAKITAESTATDLLPMDLLERLEKDEVWEMLSSGSSDGESRNEPMQLNSSVEVQHIVPLDRRKEQKSQEKIRRSVEIAPSVAGMEDVFQSFYAAKMDWFQEVKHKVKSSGNKSVTVSTKVPESTSGAAAETVPPALSVPTVSLTSETLNDLQQTLQTEVGRLEAKAETLKEDLHHRALKQSIQEPEEEEGDDFSDEDRTGPGAYNINFKWVSRNGQNAPSFSRYSPRRKEVDRNSDKTGSMRESMEVEQEPESLLFPNHDAVMPRHRSALILAPSPARSKMSDETECEREPSILSLSASAVPSLSFVKERAPSAIILPEKNEVLNQLKARRHLGPGKYDPNFDAIFKGVPSARIVPESSRPPRPEKPAPGPGSYQDQDQFLREHTPHALFPTVKRDITEETRKIDKRPPLHVDDAFTRKSPVTAVILDEHPARDRDTRIERYQWGPGLYEVDYSAVEKRSVVPKFVSPEEREPQELDAQTPLFIDDSITRWRKPAWKYHEPSDDLGPPNPPQHGLDHWKFYDPDYDAIRPVPAEVDFARNTDYDDFAIKEHESQVLSGHLARDRVVPPVGFYETVPTDLVKTRAPAVDFSSVVSRDPTFSGYDKDMEEEEVREGDVLILEPNLDAIRPQPPVLVNMERQVGRPQLEAELKEDLDFPREGSVLILDAEPLKLKKRTPMFVDIDKQLPRETHQDVEEEIYVVANAQRSYFNADHMFQAQRGGQGDAELIIEDLTQLRLDRNSEPRGLDFGKRKGRDVPDVKQEKNIFVKQRGDEYEAVVMDRIEEEDVYHNPDDAFRQKRMPNIQLNRITGRVSEKEQERLKLEQQRPPNPNELTSDLNKSYRFAKPNIPVIDFNRYAARDTIPNMPKEAKPDRKPTVNVPADETLQGEDVMSNVKTVEKRISPVPPPPNLARSHQYTKPVPTAVDFNRYSSRSGTQRPPRPPAPSDKKKDGDGKKGRSGDDDALEEEKQDF